MLERRLWATTGYIGPEAEAVQRCQADAGDALASTVGSLAAQDGKADLTPTAAPRRAAEASDKPDEDLSDASPDLALAGRGRSDSQSDSPSISAPAD